MHAQFFRIFLTFFFISNYCDVFAYEFSTKAVVRNKKFKAKIVEVILKDLIRNDSFSGQYFKIVLGKSNEAIQFNADPGLVLRASTVYYHLTIAREFFARNFSQHQFKEFNETKRPMTIRLEISNAFNALAHFSNDNLDPQFNNALSVPAGKGIPSRNISKWNQEIWFRPMKKIKLKDIKSNTNSDIRALLKEFRNQQHMVTLQRFIGESVRLFGNSPQGFFVDSLMRTAGSALILEAIFQASNPINWLFAPKRYYLDSALVPEIIYHEYAHIALSDSIELTHSSPVNEGLADYFAGRIADNPKLAKKIKRFSNFQGKNAAHARHYYNNSYEMLENANNDFVFALLWKVYQEFGAQISDQLIYQSRTLLNSSSNVRYDLLESLLIKCEEICPNKKIDRLKLYQLFHRLGL